MRFFRKASIVLLVLSLVILTLMTSLTASAASLQNYPKSINGLPVIFVKTHENTVGYDSDQVAIVLLDNRSSSARESLASNNFQDLLSKKPLPEGWEIEVYGGPNASKEEFLKIHEENNKKLTKYGDIQVGMLSFTEERTLLLDPRPTFAMFTDEDCGEQTVSGLKAKWEAPTVGDYQTYYSAFMLNGTSDQGFFLQAGQLYQDGEGSHIWSTNTVHYVRKLFNLTYIEGNECEYDLTHLPGTGYWWISAEDIDESDFDYTIIAGSGTVLVDAEGTCLFFENWNTNANWYQGFSNPISAYAARDYVSSWGYWSTGSIIIWDSDYDEQENDGIITGSVLNNGTAYWWLDSILLRE